MLDEIGGHNDVLGIDVHLVESEGIRDVGHFIVLDLASDVAMALEEHDLPGFIPIGNGVGATAGRVAIFGH